MNVLGLTSLMNPQNVDGTKDGKSVENEITGRRGGGQSSRPPAESIMADHRNELRDLMAEYGLSDSDEEPEAPPPPTFSAPAQSRGRSGGGGGENSGGRSGGGGEDRGGGGSGGSDAGTSLDFNVSALMMDDPEPPEPRSIVPREQPHGSRRGGSRRHRSPPPRSEDSGEDSESDGSDDSDDDSDASLDSGNQSGVDLSAASEVLREIEKDWGIDLSDESFERSRTLPAAAPPTGGYDGYDHIEGRRRRRDLTSEQTQRRHIEAVLGNLRDETHTTFGAQREREQDMKASKLEQIAQLRETLEEDGIKTEAVGNPSASSPMEEIDAVLRILRLKNDRNRCASLAEEIILGAAEMIECVFDGTQSIPMTNGYSPDYTGYHNTVNVKMHRMRYETASVVSGIVDEYNLGPMSRIMLELLPSLFLYPRQQQHQRSRPGLHNDPSIVGTPRVGDARRAYSEIRARDEVNTTMRSRGNDQLDTI